LLSKKSCEDTTIHRGVKVLQIMYVRTSRASPWKFKIQKITRHMAV
jgi:hypothetical protein